MRSTSHRAWRIAGGAAGAAALTGIAYVAKTWLRYGHATTKGRPPGLLDQYVPTFDVIEHHAARIHAPVDIAYAAARHMSFASSPIIAAIFRGRELLMHATPEEPREPQSIVDECLALGWGVLAQDPGRELVMGAVTRPWEADVRFRSLPPDEFAAFDEPGWVKIAWNLRVQPIDHATSRFSSETRVATTDAEAKRRFRRYWTMVAPGVRLIRREALRLVRAEAARRQRLAREEQPSPATDARRRT